MHEPLLGPVKNLLRIPIFSLFIGRESFLWGKGPPPIYVLLILAVPPSMNLFHKICGFAAVVLRHEAYLIVFPHWQRSIFWSVSPVKRFSVNRLGHGKKYAPRPPTAAIP
jgi:hypothetical protein